MSFGFNEKNPSWKSREVGYGALHGWVKRRLIKPKNCATCNKEISLDLANISQKYKREVADWVWLCRRCHMQQDGRFENPNIIASQFKVGNKNRLGEKLSKKVRSIISDKVKEFWKNPEYRKHMVEIHKKKLI